MSGGPVKPVPFNRPFLSGREMEYLRQAHENGHLSGNGPFTHDCQQLLKKLLAAPEVLLTHSCTAALEMAAILANVGPGDEVVMPSFTFVSTANAFVLRGGVPVFVDIRPDTLNIDERLIEAALTDKTRALALVHYAGVGCEMEPILELAQKRGLTVIEDAAQGLLADYRGRALGSMGQLGALSFHETKNIISGEGGALAINDPALIERAEIIWEKGTDRRRFHRGEVDKYTWRDLGSSYLPSELIAAFLKAQLEQAEELTRRRLAAWNFYHDNLAEAERRGFLKRPSIPPGLAHNGHLYYILLNSPEERPRLLERLRERGLGAVFHYVPLHSSPAGRRFGRACGDMAVTDDRSARLVRLPLWVGLSREDQALVLDELLKGYE